jgi:hypothetical protein
MVVASPELTERIGRIEDELRRMGARLDCLERGSVAIEREGEAPRASPAAETQRSAAMGEDGPGTVALVGRAILVLGGGFLIRALTGGGYVSPSIGVGVGLAYAVGWLLASEREAARGRRLSATFHGIVTTLLAYPLLWEAVTRFDLLRAGAATALSAILFTALALVSARRGLVFVSWLVALVALATNFGLLFATHDVLAIVYGLLGLAVVVLVLALFDLEPGLRWPVALAADLAVLILVLLACRSEGLPAEYQPFSPGRALVAALALPAVFLGATIADTLGRVRRVDAFAVAQGTLALAVGFGGGAAIVVAQGQTPWALGLVGLLTGGMCYWAAFAFVERRHAHASSFYLYSSAGGVLTFLSTGMLFWREPAALVWCALALVLAQLGRRFDRMTLRNQATEYLLGAAVAGGLLGAIYASLFGAAVPSGMEWTAVVVLASVIATGLLLLGRRLEPRWWQRVPEVIPTALASLGLAGVVVTLLAPWLGSRPDALAALATLRTAALSTAAVGLAEAARRWSFEPARTMVFVLLALAGLRMVADDLPRGNPAFLFVSFVFYGIALILAPRRLRA